MKHYIGIDPATKCGWAVMNEKGELIASGTWNLAPRRHESSAMRWVKFRKSFDELVQTYSPAAVAYEEVARHAGTNAAHVYGGLVAIMQAYMEEAKINFAGIPVGTVKKHATGKGNAKKEAMMAAFAEKFGRDAKDDNEADAAFIVDSYIEQFV